jgi:hypothetical protein
LAKRVYSIKVERIKSKYFSLSRLPANLSDVNKNSSTTTTTNTPTLETSTQKNVEKDEAAKKEDSNDWSGKW